MSSTIGFIGLGHMGGPMAQNLLKAGHRLQVFDLVPQAVQALAQAGATAASSAAEAVAGADLVITMLPASRHVESLYLGDDGLLASIARGTLVLECSTIAPESARKVSAAAAQRGIRMIDAPVSGGTGGAVAGTLTFIVGGGGRPPIWNRPGPTWKKWARTSSMQGTRARVRSRRSATTCSWAS